MWDHLNESEWLSQNEDKQPDLQITMREHQMAEEQLPPIRPVEKHKGCFSVLHTAHSPWGGHSPAQGQRCRWALDTEGHPCFTSNKGIQLVCTVYSIKLFYAFQICKDLCAGNILICFLIFSPLSFQVH